MKVKELIAKLKNCDKDWNIKFGLDDTVLLDQFFIHLNSNDKTYTIYQGNKTKNSKCEYCGSITACDCIERVYCKKQGEPGHCYCGFCFIHNQPRFICGCFNYGK